MVGTLFSLPVSDRGTVLTRAWYLIRDRRGFEVDKKIIISNSSRHERVGCEI